MVSGIPYSTIRAKVAAMKVRAVLVLVVTILSGSCWQPGFDASIAASAIITDSMTLAATGTFRDVNEYSIRNGEFLPYRSSSPEGGFWMRGDDSYIDTYGRLYPLYLPLGETGVSYNWYGGTEADAVSAYSIPVYLSPTGSASALVYRRDYDSAGLTRFTIPDTSGTSIQQDTSGPKLSSYFSNTVIIGTGMVPDPLLPTSDRGCMIFRDGSGVYRATVFQWNGTMPLSLAPFVDLGWPADLSPAGPVAVGFAGATADYIYLSFIDTSSERHTLRWNRTTPASQPVELDQVAGPLVAILSDGSLLADGGQSYLLYSTDGNPIGELHSGALRFVHEVYDTTGASGQQWLATFCRELFVAGSHDDSGTLRLDVFTIPTTGLEALTTTD